MVLVAEAWDSHSIPRQTHTTLGTAGGSVYAQWVMGKARTGWQEWALIAAARSAAGAPAPSGCDTSATCLLRMHHSRHLQCDLPAAPLMHPMHLWRYLPAACCTR